jgi:hypothetical protein
MLFFHAACYGGRSLEPVEPRTKSGIDPAPVRSRAVEGGTTLALASGRPLMARRFDRVIHLAGGASLGYQRRTSTLAAPTPRGA